MSDFIDFGDSVVRKEYVVGFIEKERDGQKVIEIWLDKQKCPESVVIFTPNNQEGYDWMVNYVRLALGLSYNEEILSND